MTVRGAAFQPDGVLPALVTPFTKDERVDEEALRALIRHVLPNVDGIVLNGTTGESVYLTSDERQRVIEIAVEEAAGRVAVVAGTGAPSTKETIDLTIAAERAGASACLVVTPYFLHPSDKGIYQHFWRVAAATSLPVILYNIPQAVDAYLPRTVIEDLVDIPNIVALKDSSGNLTYTMEVLEMTGGRLDVLIGHDEVVLPALAAGCCGMILASAQVFPEIWQKVLSCVRAGDLVTARNLQRSVQKLSRIFCRHGGGVAVKAALNMLGVKVGAPRRPLVAQGGVLINEVRAEIRMELEKLGKVPSVSPARDVPVPELARRFAELGLSEEVLHAVAARLGAASVGEGAEWASIDLVCGKKEGPVGEAYALQLTYPRQGHEALTTILEPNLTVRPAALIVPVGELSNLRQANMIYGPTQAAVGRAIADALANGLIPRCAWDEEVMLARVWIDARALDRRALYRNAYHAMTEALSIAYGEAMQHGASG